MDAIFPNVRQIWMLSQKSRDVGWVWMSHTLVKKAEKAESYYDRNVKIFEVEQSIHTIKKQSSPILLLVT